MKALVVGLLSIGWLNAANAQTNEYSLKVLASEYPPFLFADENGNATGFSVDISNEIQSRLGWNYTIEVQPWARVLKQLYVTPNLLVFNYAQTNARKHTVHYSYPYSYDSIHFFALSSRPDVVINEPEELKAYSVVTYRGSSVSPYLEELGFKPSRWAKADNPEQLIGLLEKERVDLVVDYEKGFLANNLHYEASPVVKQPVSRVLAQKIGIGYALSLQSDLSVLEAINNELRSLEKSGELKALEDK